MFASFLVCFREVLEIAIILSIVMAATRGAPGRGFWVLVGLGGGLAGAGLVALFADSISDAMEGMGQEYFNALVLIIASGMIGWTVVWMKRHAKQLVLHIRQVGHEVVQGRKPLYSVALVVSLAMWREGAEIVLFMAGILTSSTESLAMITAGGVAGGASAALIGAMLYFGLIGLPTKHLFSVSGTLLILVACGMSAQGANYLVQAGALPELASPLWDTSAWLPEDGFTGRVLHAMIGYTAQPSGMQLLWYVGTLALITLAVFATRDSSKRVNKATPATSS